MAVDSHVRAIRIIRGVGHLVSPDPPVPPLESSASREDIDQDHLQCVRDIIIEALQSASAVRLAACVEKLKELHGTSDSEMTLKAAEIHQTLHQALNPVAAHTDIEISRILELLED